MSKFCIAAESIVRVTRRLARSLDLRSSASQDDFAMVETGKIIGWHEVYPPRELIAVVSQDIQSIY